MYLFQYTLLHCSWFRGGNEGPTADPDRNRSEDRPACASGEHGTEARYCMFNVDQNNSLTYTKITFRTLWDKPEKVYTHKEPVGTGYHSSSTVQT